MYFMRCEVNANDNSAYHKFSAVFFIFFNSYYLLWSDREKSTRLLARRLHTQKIFISIRSTRVSTENRLIRYLDRCVIYMGNGNSRFGKCWPSKISTTATTVWCVRVCVLPVAISSLLMRLSLLFSVPSPSPYHIFFSVTFYCRYCCCFQFIFIVFYFVFFLFRCMCVWYLARS